MLLTSQPGCILLNVFLPRKPSNTLDVRPLAAQGFNVPPGGMPAPVQLDPSEGPKVVMEIRGGERHMEKIPLPENGMFVQDLVQQAKLHENFGQLSISIMRQNGSNPPLRLTLRTDDKGNVTNIGQNYALHPGDYIIVYQDQRNYLERFIDKTIKMKS